LFACDAIPAILLQSLGYHQEVSAELDALVERWTAAVGEPHDYVLSLKGAQALHRGNLETARRYLSDLWKRVDKLPRPLCMLDTGKAYAESLAWGGDYEGAAKVAEAVYADGEKRKNLGEYREKSYFVAAARDLMARMLATLPKTSSSYD